MQNVQFEGQTKTKLGNTEARAPVEAAVIEGLDALMGARGYKKTFDEIIKKAQGAAKVRLAAKQAKENARAKNSIDGLTLVGKLASCSGRKPELNEMFIVEGDSAGGTAKQARIRQFQSILPLRGKPLNVEKKRLDQILANEEIRTIISAIGAGSIPISSWIKSITTKSSSCPMPTRTVCISAAFCSPSFSVICVRSSMRGTSISVCRPSIRFTRGQGGIRLRRQGASQKIAKVGKGYQFSAIRGWAK